MLENPPSPNANSYANVLTVDVQHIDRPPVNFLNTDTTWLSFFTFSDTLLTAKLKAVCLSTQSFLNMKVFDVFTYDAFNSYLVDIEKLQLYLLQG